MKILVTGVTGLLGSELVEGLKDKHEVIGVARTSRNRDVKTYNFDIADKDAAYQTITTINPDLIIHTAAQSNVDECERDPENAYRNNSLATRNLALASQRFDTELLYISTDYVFSGEINDASGYKEFDTPRPISVYGASKLHGEWFVQHLLNKFYIVRSSWLFGDTRQNFIVSMAQSFREEKPINVVTDMVSAPTYVKDLSRAIGELISSGKYGIYHISNAGFASRLEIAQFVSKHVKGRKELIKQSTQEALHMLARRPKFSALRNFIWQVEGFAPLRRWEDAVEEFLSEYQST